jgi:hypothetical protein
MVHTYVLLRVTNEDDLTEGAYFHKTHCRDEMVEDLIKAVQCSVVQWSSVVQGYSVEVHI